MAVYDDINKLYSVTVTGLVSGVRSVLVLISFATLIFSGALSAHLASGISIALFSGAAISLLMAFCSSYEGTVGLPHSMPAAILAVVTVNVAGLVMASGAEDHLFSTVVAVLMITSILTGFVFLLLGLLKLGDLIRYIPYPVIGGFVAGTGWLLIKGSFGAMIGSSLDLDHVYAIVDPAMISYWLPGFIFGIILFIMSKAGRHFIILPTLLVGAIWIFYGGLWFLDISLADAMSRGLLLGPFPEKSEKLITYFRLGPIEWSAVTAVLPDLGVIAILSVVAVLLYASGIEMAVARDMDLNQELRAAGLANLVAAMGGGLVGYHIMSLTVLTHRMQAASRWVGTISAGICLLTLSIGASMVSYFPRAVMAGLLIFIGIDFLYEWLVKAWRRLPPAEYYVVLVIFITVAGFGFLAGVAAGGLSALILFFVNYSRLNVVHYTVSGADYHSSVDRSDLERQVLAEHGDELLVLKLHGFIFFGTANNLLRRIKARVQDSERFPLRYLILDFRMVNGLDSSAVNVFTRIKHMADRMDFKPGFCDVSMAIMAQLEYCGFYFEPGVEIEVFEDMDHALESFENHMLSEVDQQKTPIREPLINILKREFPPNVEVMDFLKYLTPKKVRSGHYLMIQDTPSEALYFLESGRLTAELVLADGRSVRLKSMSAGTVVGEIGVVMGLPRTASVKADADCVVYRLTKKSLSEMEAEDPLAAAAFHRFLVRMLAQRLADTNNLLRAVLE